MAEAPGPRNRAIRGAPEAIRAAAPDSPLKEREAVWKERRQTVRAVGTSRPGPVAAVRRSAQIRNFRRPPPPWRQGAIVTENARKSQDVWAWTLVVQTRAAAFA